MKKFDIGILGGGQLGRLILEEAKAWGLSCQIMDPDPTAPAVGFADGFLCASLDDPQALRKMAEESHVLTIEIENVDASTLLQLEKEGHRILPSPRHLITLQDKGHQKMFFKQAGLPTAAFVLLEQPEDVLAHLDMFPAVAKLRRAGYDGQGVARFESAEEAVKQIFKAPYYLEPFIDIKKELSLIVLRDESGQLTHYPPVEMVFHKANLLDYLLAPAEIPKEIAQAATEIAIETCRAIDYVGVLAVELFWTKDNQLLINELAPRVHNSGHHTREAHYSSQFGQLIRILQRWPLGSTQPRAPIAALINIIGPEEKYGRPRYEGLAEILAEEGSYVYIYGKKESRPNRKLGHINLLGTDKQSLLQRIKKVKTQLQIHVDEDRSATSLNH